MNFTISTDILCELLEVSLHQILYTREIYPAIAFRRRGKYNIPVQMAIHPALSSYISDCVASVKPILEKGEIQKLIVVILSEEKVIMEKFIFDIVQHAVEALDIKSTEMEKLEESLRAFCLKLSISDSLLKPLPKNCSFSIQIEVPESYKDKTEFNFAWIPPEESEVTIKDPTIVPLKTMKSDMCHMQLYVEQSNNAFSNTTKDVAL